MVRVELKRFGAHKTVIPAVQGGKPTFLQEESIPGDDITHTSLIPLQTGETLVASFSADLDLDGYDDQVIAVKTPDSPFIKVAAGLYNPLVNRYERAVEITTDIEQAKTFYCRLWILPARMKIQLS